MELSRHDMQKSEKSNFDWGIWVNHDGIDSLAFDIHDEEVHLGSRTRDRVWRATFHCASHIGGRPSTPNVLMSTLTWLTKLCFALASPDWIGMMIRKSGRFALRACETSKPNPTLFTLSSVLSMCYKSLEVWEWMSSLFFNFTQHVRLMVIKVEHTKT